jgi:cellulose synthase operon protein YhjQ
MKGGVGKTSTTANLAAAIAETLGDDRVAVVDLDPQNSLNLHFGIDTTGKKGVCAQSLAGGNWRDVALASAFQVTCMPYGTVTEPEREGFEQLLGQQPDWLGTQLAQSQFSTDGVVLLDTPPGPSVYLRQAFACADLVVIVLLADAGSFITIPAMEAWIHDMQLLRPNLGCIYVLNQIDTALPLRRDIVEVLRNSLGDRLAPIGIHCDEAVSEALAFQQPVLRYDPHGQATQDIRRLAAWLLAAPPA